MPPRLGHYGRAISQADPLVHLGRVSQVVGLVAEAKGLMLPVGSGVFLHMDSGPAVLGEVVGFKGDSMLIMPYAETRGLRPGCLVSSAGIESQVKVGPELLGRVIDGLGQALDGRPDPNYKTLYPLYNDPPPPMSRRRITEPVDVGVRAVNSLAYPGQGPARGHLRRLRRGQEHPHGHGGPPHRRRRQRHRPGGRARPRGARLHRARPGPRGPGAQRGHRGHLRPPGLLRIRAAYLATAMAEYFRDQGADVVLMMDSVTRFAMAAARGGALGRRAAHHQGLHPQRLRPAAPPAGARRHHRAPGSITGIYTVLVDGDDINEPIADAMRAILDGHVVLTRRLAEQGHYPAIEVLGSVSRLISELNTPEVLGAARGLTELLAAYRRAEDLINIGAYAEGTNPKIDRALRLMERINAFLRQPQEQGVTLAASREQLLRLMQEK